MVVVLVVLGIAFLLTDGGLLARLKYLALGALVAFAEYTDLGRDISGQLRSRPTPWWVWCVPVGLGAVVGLGLGAWKLRDWLQRRRDFPGARVAKKSKERSGAGNAIDRDAGCGDT